tara:strand:+ start:5857 stop:6042 length:186 start_codon:yes stop_codon:yes gene_type:complete
MIMTEKIATTASYVTSGSLVIGGYALNDIAIIVGITLGVFTFAVNLYYKQKHLELERKRKE